MYLKNIKSEEEQREERFEEAEETRSDLKRKNEETIWRGTIWSSDLPSKNEEEEGKTIWRRWINPADEETQEDEETQNKERSNDEEQRWRKLGLKMVKLESLKLEFHLDFYPMSDHPLQIEALKPNFYLRTRVLDTRDTSFQHCFATWKLTKFFDI